MVTINLLPWRDYARIYERKYLRKMILINLIILSVLFISARLFITNQEIDLQSRIMYLQKEIKKYDVPLIKKQVSFSPSIYIKPHTIKKLLAGLVSINGIQVCFANVERVGDKISFVGKAHSAADLTEFLSQWKAASLFSQIKIQSIEQQENDGIGFGFQAIQDIS